MGKDGARRCRKKASVDVDVEALDNVGNQRNVRAEARQYLRLALQTMIEISLQEGARIENGRTMSWVKDFVVSRLQFPQTRHVLAHVAVGRRHHGR